MGDETRRSIVTLLNERSQTVGELADRLPVSRPAVSQHVKHLRDAGLVVVAKRGTRSVVHLDPAGVGTLREYLDRLWTGALEAMQSLDLGSSATMKIERSVVVPGNPDVAFDLFTSGIERWWPLKQGISYGGARTVSIHLEPHVGGRFFERFDDGDELEVGRVLDCTPPDRVVFTWTAPGWPAQTEVEVRFMATGDDTRVALEHRLFERLGPDGESFRDRFAGGWPTVLECFAAAARGDRPQ